MENVDALWRMEDEFWKGGAETYRRNLSEDSLMVFPGMVSTKAQTIEAISSAPRWISVTFDDRRTVSLADGAVALNYRASARRDGDETLTRPSPPASTSDGTAAGSLLCISRRSDGSAGGNCTLSPFRCWALTWRVGLSPDRRAIAY